MFGEGGGFGVFQNLVPSGYFPLSDEGGDDGPGRTDEVGEDGRLV